MYLFNFYFSIGLFSAFVFVGYWWLYKDRVDTPASPSLMLLRVGTYILVWPVLYWKWFKSDDKTRFITDPDYVWPEPRPVDPETVKRNEQKAQLETRKALHEWEAFVDALPLCGSHVMYKGTDIYGERLAGRFIFETADLLPMVFDRLNPKPFSLNDDASARDCYDAEAEIDSKTSARANPHSGQNTQEHYIHRWLRTYDPTHYVCNVVPNTFDRFEYIASDMIGAGKGQVHCKSCDTVYTASEIKAGDEDTGGWILGAMHCPKEHLLARRKKIHLLRCVQSE